MSTYPKERPLLFSGEMVRAILDGRKTQTRRVIKGVKPKQGNQPYDTWKGWSLDSGDRPGVFCPYGAPGDRFRISEEVTVRCVDSQTYSVQYRVDNLYLERYGSPELIERVKAYKTGVLRGVHLPTAFARPVALEITGVRVERLQEIKAGDALREGCGEWLSGRMAGLSACEAEGLVCEYRDLWESINGKGSWNANPWVWVVEFKKVQP